MTALQWWVAGLALAFAAAAALTAFGRARWAARTAALLDRLEATREVPQPARVDLRGLAALPPPVLSFLHAALTDGMPLVAAVSIGQRGTFNLGVAKDRWRPFVARQRVVTRRPGFAWDAAVSLIPGIAVNVHDAYVDGEGLLRPAVAGLMSLGEQRDRGDLAVGELMRFLAEAPCYPTALLPGQGVTWEAVDERSARATLRDATLAVTLTFTFGDDALIESVRAEARGRTVAGKTVPTPWEGRWTDYRLCEGMRVPFAGEVAWLLPEGRKAYWRGTSTGVRYEFAQ